jgi:hypothetical protein
MSLIVSAPSAIATARSTNTRPGSCRGRGPRTPSSAALSSPVNVVASASSTSSLVPACDTTPAPSAVTVIFRERTGELPLIYSAVNFSAAG